MTIDQLRALFSEILQRYCDNPIRKIDCDMFKTALSFLETRFAIGYLRNRCETDGVPVDINVPAGVTDGGIAPASDINLFFRNFAASDGGAVVYAAAHDSEANGGTFDAQDVNSPNGAATVAPPILLLFAMLVGFLF
jgi:hypothetical protein